MEEKISTRKIFGENLPKLGLKYKNLVILEADLTNSLYTLNFAKTFPERHFTVGYAENLAISMGCGMTVRGKLPLICGSAANLTGKAWDEIKNSIALPNLNIKIIGSNAGISNSEDGIASQALHDLAIMRCLPNFKIIYPADAIETKAALEAMINDFGPTYLRLPKENSEIIYQTQTHFQLGKAHIFKSGEDICLFSHGILLGETIKAAEELEKRGVSVRIVNVSSLAPLDEETIIKCAEECKLLISIEDHAPIGGLSSAIIEVLSSKLPKKLHSLSVKSFNENGKFEDLLRKNQLDAKGIYEQVRNWWTEN